MFGETKTRTYRFLRNPEETALIQPQFHPTHHNTENCSVSLKLTNHGATFLMLLDDILESLPVSTTVLRYHLQ